MSAAGRTSVLVVLCVYLGTFLVSPVAAALHDKALGDAETMVARLEDAHRVRRFVPFPSGSKIVAEFALSLPTGATIGLSNIVLATGLTMLLPTETVTLGRKYEQSASDRIYLYNNLESFLTSLGYDGHACTLRTLCEVAESPFEHDLYGDLINLVLSASRSPDSGKEYDEYQLAEYYGKSYGDCGEIYPGCPSSVLDSVSTAF